MSSWTIIKKGVKLPEDLFDEKDVFNSIRYQLQIGDPPGLWVPYLMVGLQPWAGEFRKKIKGVAEGQEVDLPPFRFREKNPEPGRAPKDPPSQGKADASPWPSK